MTGDDRLRWALLAVFSAHNAEEVWHLPTDVADLRQVSGGSLEWADRRTFGTATVLLTGLVGGLLATGAVRRSPVADIVGAIAASALVGNAASHGARAVARRRYNGGLATAPLMAWIGVRFLRVTVGHLLRRDAVLLNLGANLLAVPLILTSLRIARSIVHPNPEEKAS